MKNVKCLAIAGVITALMGAAPLSADTVLKFNGSSTTHKMLLPYATSAGSAHGATIAFVPNGTGHGVEDLAAGRADVAMVTGTIEYFGELLNARNPGTIDVAKTRAFQLPDLPKTAATAIVHPSNTVAKLTHAQLQGLFSGQIANWKEVGGPDLAVVVVLPDPMDGVFAAFTTGIMKGTPFAANCRRVALATDLPKIVAQIPGAIAFLSVANAVGAVKPAAPEPQFIPPNFLVTIGEPAEPLKSVISDFQARVK